LAAVTAFAQTPGSLRVTDPEKIADALRAGPTFITAHATVRNWPSAPGGEYRLIRKGSRPSISASGNGRKMGSSHDFHVGPHLMIVVPKQDEFQGFNRDATSGMPYVTHLRDALFLVMPIRQWNEQ
jgi:hypothetical protein